MVSVKILVFFALMALVSAAPSHSDGMSGIKDGVKGGMKTGKDLELKGKKGIDDGEESCEKTAGKMAHKVPVAGPEIGTAVKAGGGMIKKAENVVQGGMDEFLDLFEFSGDEDC